MLKTHSTETLGDAQALIRSYGLELLDWGGVGTAEGLAHRLFHHGATATVEDMRVVYSQYLADCKTADTKAVDHAAVRQALETQRMLDASAKQRKKLADFIKAVKRQASGQRCWSLIAAMATSSQPEKLATSLNVSECAELLAVLDGLVAFEPHFSSMTPVPYSPGSDEFMDRCLRVDIACFEIQLEAAEPSRKRGAQRFMEMAALLRLARHQACRRALADGHGRSKGLVADLFASAHPG